MDSYSCTDPFEEHLVITLHMYPSDFSIIDVMVIADTFSMIFATGTATVRHLNGPAGQV